MMVDMTNDAGLNVCDTRMLYEENRSSTPTKEKVCSSDNIDCWDGACREASGFSCPPVPKFNNMFDSEGEVVKKPVVFRNQGAWEFTNDESLSPSKQPPPVRDSDSDLERELDYSYGGHWAMRQETPPSLPSSPSPYLNFGISVFDQTESQVLSKYVTPCTLLGSNRSEQKAGRSPAFLRVYTKMVFQTTFG